MKPEVNCSEDIHSDGSVELLQRWRPGGAQGNTEQAFDDGAQYLFAIRLAGDTWEFHTVTAKVDELWGCDFELANGNSWGDWSWDDVEWFCPACEFDLPYVH